MGQEQAMTAIDTAGLRREAEEEEGQEKGEHQEQEVLNNREEDEPAVEKR